MALERAGPSGDWPNIEESLRVVGDRQDSLTGEVGHLLHKVSQTLLYLLLIMEKTVFLSLLPFSLQLLYYLVKLLSARIHVQLQLIPQSYSLPVTKSHHYSLLHLFITIFLFLIHALFLYSTNLFLLLFLFLFIDLLTYTHNIISILYLYYILYYSYYITSLNYFIIL